MPVSRAPQLVGGPYNALDVRPGDRLRCKLRGPQVVVALRKGAANTLARRPLTWPFLGRDRQGRFAGSPVCGDLVKALQIESGMAIRFYWRVSKRTVTRWRASLGVGKWTDGTYRRAREHALELRARLTPETLAEGGRKAARVRTWRPSRA